MTAHPAAAREPAERPDSVPLNTWEQAIADRAGEAAAALDMCLMSANTHVHAIAEVIRARVTERGGDIAAEVMGAIEALKRDFNALLDQLAATRPGS